MSFDLTDTIVTSNLKVSERPSYGYGGFIYGTSPYATAASKYAGSKGDVATPVYLDQSGVPTPCAFNGCTTFVEFRYNSSTGDYRVNSGHCGLDSNIYYTFIEGHSVTLVQAMGLASDEYKIDDYVQGATECTISLYVASVDDDGFNSIDLFNTTNNGNPTMRPTIGTHKCLTVVNSSPSASIRIYVHVPTNSLLYGTFDTAYDTETKPYTVLGPGKSFMAYVMALPNNKLVIMRGR